ncbi:MAG: T9SS type A sorting domain-containing protein [Bacteroidales bacterium]|nr:T9SS type A sorting domain-containing protein [Bacteroidales bacterium]MCF8456351.1 T9SS type A sorting domain-containing protein [Bacteroidales bacterium]
MKKEYIILLLLLMVFTSVSQIKFQEQIISTQLFQFPGTIVSADLDQDNDIDLLISSTIDDKILWFENQGGGYFGILHLISVEPGNPATLQAIDLDNDGDVDVIAAMSDINKIAWYKNDGTGHFNRNIIDSNLISTPLTLYVSDLDNDGDIDILSASLMDNKIVWYENDSIGNFGSQQVISTAVSFPMSVYAAYMDEDGLIDVISASFYDNKIAWYKNLGNGTFGQQAIISQQLLMPNNVSSYDIDGDGDMDILSVSAYSHETAWFQNNGLGSFGPKQIITSNNYTGLVYSGDIDSDNDFDIITPAEVYINSGAGVFNTTIYLDNTNGQTTFADYDNDGDMDIASTIGVSNLVWYPNNGTGNFGARNMITFGINGPKKYVFSDIDADNLKDIIVGANDYFLSVCWFKNYGNGNYILEDTINIAFDHVYDLYVEDLDGDSLLDVISLFCDNSTQNIGWNKQDSSGHFGPIQIVCDSAVGGSDIHVSDIDGDGDYDILFGSTGNNYPNFDSKLFLWKNNGSGNFGNKIIIRQGSGAINDIKTFDLNNDGNMDILFTENLVKWGKNLGGANNFQFIPIGDSWYSKAVNAADLDGDNDLDVVYSTNNQNPYGSHIGWAKNNGNGTFANSTQLFPAWSTDEIELKDMDKDGDIDIIVEQYSQPFTLFWLENDGLGNFVYASSGYSPCIADSIDVTSIVVDDLDGDGDNDVLYNSKSDGLIAWAENLGYITSASDSACANQPFAFGSQLLISSGTYHDTLQTIFGLDSVVELAFSQIPVPVVSLAPFPQNEICFEESSIALPMANPLGGYYSGPGVVPPVLNISQAGVGTHEISYLFTDTATGCSNSNSTELIVNALPIVSISPFPQDTFCIQTGTIDFPLASPLGGYFAGSGVTASNINLNLADTGTHEISYHFTDTTTGCTNSDTTQLIIIFCLSVAEEESMKVSVYPNPTSSFINIGFNNLLPRGTVTCFLYNSTGKEILVDKPTEFPYQIDIRELKAGLYYLKVVMGEKAVRYKIVKQ